MRISIPFWPISNASTAQRSWLIWLIFLLAFAGTSMLAQSPPESVPSPPPSEDHEGHSGHAHGQDGVVHDHASHAHDADAHAAGRDHHGEAHGGHQLHHDFSDAERWAAIFDEPERLEWQRPEEVVQHMKISDGATVVDLGAGTGFFLPFLAKAASHGKVLGLDPEENLVHHMRQRVAEADLGQVEIRRIPYDDPELAAGSVDRLLIVNTWHHIEQREVYASKLLAALASDGMLFVVDFTLDSPSGPPKKHRLPPQEVIAELIAGGFEAEVIEETLPRQYIVVGRRPQ